MGVYREFQFHGVSRISFKQRLFEVLTLITKRSKGYYKTWELYQMIISLLRIKRISGRYQRDSGRFQSVLGRFKRFTEVDNEFQTVLQKFKEIPESLTEIQKLYSDNQKVIEKFRIFKRYKKVCIASFRDIQRN